MSDEKNEIHAYYKYQLKHTIVTVTNHPNIQAVDVAEDLNIYPVTLYHWRGEMLAGKIQDNDRVLILIHNIDSLTSFIPWHVHKGMQSDQAPAACALCCCGGVSILKNWCVK